MSAADQIRATLLKFEAGEGLYHVLDKIPLDHELAVLAMKDGLRSTSSRAAAGCANALGTKTPRPPLVVPALIEALDHGEVSVRTAAVGALGKYGAGEAVEPILRCLARGEDDFHAKPFVEALGAIAQQVDRVL